MAVTQIINGVPVWKIESSIPAPNEHQAQVNSPFSVTEIATTQSPKVPVDVKDLFKATEVSEGPTSALLGKLPRAISHAKAALEALDNDNTVVSDDEMMHVRVLCARLFPLQQNFGDGFGIVLNSILSAIENRKGAPMTRRQIVTITSALKLIRARPRLDVAVAIEAVTAMELEQLEVDPAGTDKLIGCAGFE